MPEELSLLLEKVEGEGAGVTIPYVYPKSPLVFRRSSLFCMFSSNLANRWPSQRVQVQPPNLKRFTNNNPFAVHTDRAGPHSPRVITNLFSPSQTKSGYTL